MKKASKMEVMPVKCITCPFRDGSPYEYLRADLSESAMTQASRICHSTGRNAIHSRTGKPEKLCRGARDLQLQMFYRIGFLPEPTDEAWAVKIKELGI